MLTLNQCSEITKVSTYWILAMTMAVVAAQIMIVTLETLVMLVRLQPTAATTVILVDVTMPAETTMVLVGLQMTAATMVMLLSLQLATACFYTRNKGNIYKTSPQTHITITYNGDDRMFSDDRILSDVVEELRLEREVMMKQSLDKTMFLFSRYAVEHIRELHASSEAWFVFSIGTYVGTLAPSVYLTPMSSLFNRGPTGTMALGLESERGNDAIEHVAGFDVIDDVAKVHGTRCNAIPALPVHESEGDSLYFCIIKSNPHNRKLVHGVEGIRDRHALAVISVPVLEYYREAKQVVVASEPPGGPSLEQVMLLQPSLLDLVTVQKLFLWQAPHVHSSCVVHARKTKKQNKQPKAIIKARATTLQSQVRGPFRNPIPVPGRCACRHPRPSQQSSHKYFEQWRSWRR